MLTNQYLHDRSYVDRLNDIGDKYLFFLFVIVGALSIAFFKLTIIPIKYTYIIPLVLMVSYAIWCSCSAYFKVRSDKAGDNLYYMGFLYTLVSLGVSLYQSSASDTGHETIISNFGVALITTITGVTLRVFFTQLRDTPYEVEQEAVSHLTVSARRLKGELDTALTDFNLFRTSLKQSLTEWNAEWKEERVSQLNSTTEFIEENILSIKANHQEISSSLKIVSDEIVSVKEKLANLDLHRDTFKSQLEAPINELWHFLDGFAKSFSVRLTEIDKAAYSLADFTEKEKSFAETVKIIEQHHAKQVVTLDNVIQKATQSLANFEINLSLNNENFKVQSTETSKHLNNLTQIYMDLANSAENRQNNLLNTLSLLEDRLGNSYKNMEQAVTSQTKIVEKLLFKDLDVFVNIISKRIEDIKDSAHSLKNLTEQENTLSLSIQKLSDHIGQITTESNTNFGSIKTDTVNLSNLLELQTKRLDMQLNSTEAQYGQIASLYQGLVQSIQNNTDKLNITTENLHQNLEKSYNYLAETIQLQNKQIANGEDVKVYSS